MNNTKLYATVEEVAERYRTTPSTVYGWIHKGTAPPSIRVGKRRLFDVDELASWEANLRDSSQSDPVPVA